ncbi:unnamed protein product [Strongylus vulgaris]|uniref:Uncharacterized protein n=1 Tax=Strongylus vulgaris TaxID=40348 RepID=A0A3P7J7Y2_STRVU|nr:unnamed protein product [Strongylus vulgaris]
MANGTSPRSSPETSTSPEKTEKLTNGTSPRSSPETSTSPEKTEKLTNGTSSPYKTTREALKIPEKSAIEKALEKSSRSSPGRGLANGVEQNAGTSKSPSPEKKTTDEAENSSLSDLRKKLMESSESTSGMNGEVKALRKKLEKKEDEPPATDTNYTMANGTSSSTRSSPESSKVSEKSEKLSNGLVEHLHDYMGIEEIVECCRTSPRSSPETSTSPEKTEKLTNGTSSPYKTTREAVKTPEKSAIEKALEKSSRSSPGRGLANGVEQNAGTSKSPSPEKKTTDEAENSSLSDLRKKLMESSESTSGMNGERKSVLSRIPSNRRSMTPDRRLDPIYEGTVYFDKPSLALYNVLILN